MAGTKRIPIQRPAYQQISPRAVKLFKKACAIIARDDRDSLEYWRVERALTRELGLKPWHPCFLEMTIDSEPPPNLLPQHLEFWHHVHDLRRKLVLAT